MVSFRVCGVQGIGNDLDDSGEENTPVRPNPLISLFLLEIQCRIISLLQLVVRKTGWMGFPSTRTYKEGPIYKKICNHGHLSARNRVGFLHPSEWMMRVRASQTPFAFRG